MQRLSGLDAMFFYLETPSAHMHVAGVHVVEPGDRPLGFAEVREHVRSRLPLVPLFRRRLVEVPLKVATPLWIDDPDFDLDFHVRRAALPAPGGLEELAGFTADLLGRPLDRSRPLWELSVVEGLADGRVALVTKIHHAAVDGVSGAELAAGFLDTEASPAPATVVDHFSPEPVPTDAELLAFAAASLVGHPARVARTAQRLVESALGVRERNRGGATEAPPSPFAAPKTLFNQAITPHRRVGFVDCSLEEVKAIRRHAGCTVNDVVLAVCAGALRRYLVHHGELPDEPLVALVPTSVRSDDEPARGGNRISAMLVSLATDLEHPGERLGAIAASTRAAKAQGEVVGPTTLTEWTEFTAPGLVGRASRLVSSTKVFDKVRPPFNLTISNVPGPPFPLFLGGGRVVASYPLGPVAEGASLNLTVMSYCGRLYLGATACREAVPDLDELVGLIGDSLDELVAWSGRGRRATARTAPAEEVTPDGEAPEPPAASGAVLPAVG